MVYQLTKVERISKVVRNPVNTINPADNEDFVVLKMLLQPLFMI
jgi:hypothetical protein